MTALDVDTPHGPARAHLHPAAGEARAALVLGHGAGGSVGAPDLVAVTAAAVAAGISVALVEQPYRVAGKKATPPTAKLDAAWVPVLAALRRGPLAGLPVVCGGRSSGARVACRTARAVGAAGVLCLAFPLQPPARRDGSFGPSRLPELEGTGVPTLVIQGLNDRFGMVADDTAPVARWTVVRVPGDHGLKRDVGGIARAAVTWIERTVLV